jgi:hypothetical protein
MMKRNKIIFWTLTGLLIPALGYGSVISALGDPESVKVITALGYPAYLSPFLGVAKILGLIVIFTPKFPRLKEWAYAGLSFDVIGATYSLIAIGTPIAYAMFPMVAFGLILGSYYFYHKRLKDLTVQ